jgi:hypothetical protein
MLIRVVYHALEQRPSQRRSAAADAGQCSYDSYNPPWLVCQILITSNNQSKITSICTARFYEIIGQSFKNCSPKVAENVDLAGFIMRRVALLEIICSVLCLLIKKGGAI